MADSRRFWFVGVVAICCAGLLNAQVASLPPLAGTSSVSVDAKAEGFAVRRVSVDVRNAPLRVVCEAIAKQAGLTLMHERAVFDGAPDVSVRVAGVTVRDAFAEALRGTGIRVVISASGQAVLTRLPEVAAAPVAQGSITGKVVDGKTRQGLRGATVSISGTTKGTTTSDDGSFRFSGVVPGAYTVQVRMLGYVKTSKTVTVTDGNTASVEVALEPSVNALDQVIVTGTVVATAQREVPNAMTVITAKDIQDRGITRIEQLFRGEVPGLFAQNRGTGSELDEVVMFSRGATALSNNSSGTDPDVRTNAIKTYVDGVELADSRYLSQIDPVSIDRIEILTGPQASTIYGSNAINGVMQIFTKRGATPRPQVTISMLSGWVENDFSTARAPQHDYSAQVNGIEGRISYNAGGSWRYMAPWAPSKQTSETNVFGGGRAEFTTSAGQITSDVSFRQGYTRNRSKTFKEQRRIGYGESGYYYIGGVIGINRPQTSALSGRTLGFSLGYAPFTWWTHAFKIGLDESGVDSRYEARGFKDPSDSSLFLYQSLKNRRSLSYSSTARIPVASSVQATITVGGDGWNNLTSDFSAFPPMLTGSITNIQSIYRRPDHNAGGFLQTQIALQDQLFFTYGLRAEWNPSFGAEAQPNYAPRYGITLAREMGVLTAKLRASYGRSTRPPGFGRKDAVSNTNASLIRYYGVFDTQLANPFLEPEYQQGVEYGMELFFGSRASIVVTRYNQTVENLIDRPVKDSVDLLPDARALLGRAEWETPFRQYQNMNVGDIRNQGWELQGSATVGALTGRGTYSWTKSRVLAVDARVRDFFNAVDYPQYQPGATFNYLPEHTWALGLTYGRASTSVALNLSGTGQVANYLDDFYYAHLSANIRLPENRLNMRVPDNPPGPYVSFNQSYVLTDLIASHQFVPGIEGVLHVLNLADQYRNDFWSAYASMGRQVKAGVRIRTR